MPKKRFTILSILLALSLLMSSFVGIPKLKAYADTQSTTGPELLITEIMPMSEEGVDKYEFIELYNNSDNTIDLSDYSFVAPLNLKTTEETKIPSKGILVICLNSDTSLSEFNNFYNTLLTEDKYFTPAQSYSLGDATEQVIVIARDIDDDNVLDVICSAKYKPLNFSEGKSITYKYPSSGNSMIITGQKQVPTPGKVDPYQIPNSGVYVTGVSINSNAITIKAGNSIVLSANVIPSTAANKEVIWSSNNSSVATVSSSGIVTAVRNGTANITVKTKDGGYTATCSVVVADLKVESVSLNIVSKKINVGNTFNLIAKVLPESATYKKLIWASSNIDVATVTPSGSYTGVVKGKSEGEAKITVKTIDGGYSATCTVTVTDDDDDIVDVTGVRLNKEELEIEYGDEKVLVADVLPDNASNNEVTWKSSNTEVATVSSYGVVYAKAEGETIITVKTDDGGYTDYCKVKVAETDNDDDDKIVNNIKLNKYLLVLTEGENERLIATVKPENAANKNVSWKSDNTSVATVDVNGNVKAVSQGVAIITAKTKSGNHEAKCIVVVFDDGKSVISGIRLDKTYLRIMRGKTDKLTVVGIASNKNISKIEWKSDKPGLVSVDKNGKITTSKKYTGTATITVTVTVKGNGNKKETYSAKCTVLVTHDNGNKYYKKH